MSVRVKHNRTLEYLIAEEIHTPHCFTTRRGGVSEGVFDSLNLGLHRGDQQERVEENYRIIAAELGVDLKDLVLTRQIHSDIVRVVTKADASGIDHRNYPECDALITNDPGTALVIFTADCTPILFWDPVTGAVGAAHAGWRGTAAQIAGKTVRAMTKEFGCRPEDIRAAIGPNIGTCCFETDSDVPQAMREAFGAEADDYIRVVGEKYYPDLKGLNELALRGEGVRHIEVSTECTMCEHERFWSHRYTRGERGSQGTLIVCCPQH